METGLIITNCCIFSFILLCFFQQSNAEEKDDEVPQLPPLFLTEFVLEPNQLLFKPNEEEYQAGLGEVIKRFQDCVLKVENLVPDEYFDPFTRLVCSGSPYGKNNIFHYKHDIVNSLSLNTKINLSIILSR